MRNSTFYKSGFSRLIFLIVFLLSTYSASAQFFKKHYIAPAPWQYFSDANEIIIATNSTTPVTFTITKSNGGSVNMTKIDGSAVGSTLTTVKGTPAVYRFVGNPNSSTLPLPYNAAGTIYNDRGLIITSTTNEGLVSVNLRNIASDAIGDGGDNSIKGNASLTSFGDAGIGVEFRVGYYRNMGTSDRERPFYSVMAINNNTQVKINGSLVTTLGAGQSYLFNAAIGSLVESSGPIVMNTGVRIDAPEACGDGTFDQVPPVSVLGKEYFLERGKGNDTAEQTTIVATKDGTTITINTYNATNGNEVGSPVTITRNAGEYYTFKNGVSGTQLSASRIVATNNVAVYSGTADRCEVDVSTIAPVSACGGSNFVETSTFKGYNKESLDYFGYVLLQSASATVMLNSANLETTTGTNRRQLGTTGWYIIDFNRTQIGNPNTISLSSTAKLTVSIAQQGNGYSMAAFFSNFAQQPTAPKETYVGVNGCLKQSAVLTTEPNFSPYVWRYNGTVIPNETSNSITVTKTGSYTVTSTLSCGVSSQSTPIAVTLCSDVAVENKVDVSSQCVGSNVTFTITAKNLGPSNAEGVSVTDKLPSGYTYVSSVVPTGTSYDSSTGIWTISGLDSGASVVLTITATVKDTGTYSNTATITSSNVDDPTANNSATATVTANALPTAATLSTNSPVCSGSNAVFTISGTAGNIVTYSGAASGTITIGTDGKATVTVPSVTANSTLNLTNVSDGTCNRALSVNATVTVNPRPAKPTISAGGALTFCEGGSVKLTSSASSGNQWYKDGSLISGATNTSYSATASGSYTVITNNGTCSSLISDATVVNVNSLPVAATLSTNSPVCSGSNAVFTISGTAGNIVTYSGAASGTITIGTDGKATVTVPSVTANSTLNLTNVSDGTCNRALSVNATVTVNPRPAKPTISAGGALAFCEGGSVTLTSSASSGNQWYKDGSLISGATNSSYSATASGSYTVITSNGTCSSLVSDGTSVTVNPRPIKPTISAGGALTFCEGGSVTLTSSASSGNQWYKDGSLISGATNSSYSATADGSYTVITSNGTCSSLASDGTSVTVNPRPAKPTISAGGALAFCEGGSVTLTSSASSGNQWYKDGSLISGATNSSYSATADGSYTVITNNGTCSSLASDGTSVTVNTIPVALSLTGNVICFSPGRNGIIYSSTSVNNVNYQLYDSNDTAVHAVKSGTGSALTWTDLSAANGYYVVATNAANCTAKSNVVNITTNPNPTISIGGTLTACSTTTLTTTTNANSPTYVWYKNDVVISGEVSSSLVVNADGDYKVKVRNTLTGCEQTSAVSTVKVSDTEKPVKPTLADVVEECSATVTAPTTTDNCAGTVTGTTSDPLTYSVQGDYTIHWSFTDGNGNTETATQNVTVKDTQKPAKPTLADVVEECSATVTAPTTTDNCAGTVTGTTSDPLTYSAQGDYTIHWSFTDGNGNTETATQNVTVKDTQKPIITCPGDVTVSVDANGCVATGVNLGTATTSDNCTSTVTVTNDAPLSFPIGNTTVTWMATDGAGNTQTCTQNVKVIGAIKANDDNISSSKGTVGEIVISNIFDNDELNCNKVNISDVDVTLTSSLPSVLTFNDTTGAVSVKPNTPTGTYTFDYSICEIANNGNCNSATVTIKIINDLIAVQDDFGTASSGSTAAVIGNVKGNDTLDGALVTAGNTVVKVDSSGPLSVDANGDVTLAANTPSGTYSITYEICEKDAAPANCQTATAEVKVVNGLVAVQDDFGTKSSGSTAAVIGNVKGNDTLDGALVTAGNTVVKVDSSGPLSVDANGDVTLAANTPSGTYSITYEICEKDAAPANCQTATAEVKVVNDLVAVQDDFGTKSSGSTAAVIGNVKGNDTLDGALVTAGNTVVKVDSSGPLSVDANGDVTLAANTPSGTYSITYEICEKDAAPANCQTATAEVKVVNGLVAVQDDFGTKSSGSTAAVIGNVKGNDTLYGALVTAGNTVVKVDSSGPLSVDANGDVTLAANTPSGTYSITYEICEKDAAPANCQTATAEVKVVNGLVAVQDDFGTKSSGSTAAVIGNVKGNDTLDGVLVTAGNTVVKIDSNGPLSVDANGDVTLAANTPSGTYSITYEICEKGAAPANCQTATAEVKVVNDLVAVQDDFGTASSGSTAAVIGNVKGNDTLDGVLVTAGNTVVKIDSNGPLSVDANGDVTLAANTPSGTYSITYEICEKDATPANCQTATAEVKVVNAIDAVLDTIDPINGSIGGTTISLITNDTFNNSQAVIGTNPGEVTISIVGTLPSGLTLNANGTITVNSETPKGNYSVEYKICEAGAVPTNCDSVTITVPVTAGDLVANADDIPSVSGSNAPQTLGKNIFDNDTKNGQPLDPADVTLKTSTPDPKGYLTLDPDGKIVLGANPPAGDYELTYEICEKLNPDNCSSNTVKVTVGMPAIDAVEDVIASLNGNIGGKTISLIANDKLNGNPIAVGTAAGEVKFEIVGTLPTGLTLNSDYTISVSPNTPKGDYKVEYKICEITNPTNCDSVIITVPVTAGNLVANADDIPSVSGSNAPQTLGKNIFDNDTKNGQPLDPADVTLKTSTPDPKGYLTLDSDGNIVLGANPPAGDYELTYEICEKLNPDNCSSNTVKVTIGMPVIDAVEDVIASINGNIGGKTISLIANDKLNGNPIAVGTAAGEVKFEIVGTLPTGLALNSDYTISVAPNTPKGDYKVEYKICEITNPTNCDSVIITVPVTAGDLVANADDIPSVSGSNAPQTLGKNIFDNDTKNGQPLDPADVTLKTSTPDPKGYLTLDSDGNIVLGANPPAGDYELTYEICEKLNPDNCSSNTVKVTIGMPVIDAVEDVIASINGNIGGKTISLIANDKLNGNPIAVGTAAGEVKFEIVGTLPTGLALNSDYTISVAPNTPKGDYKVEYKICEITNPTNCDSVIITVPVTAGNLVANADDIPSVSGSNAPQTLGKNIFDNDTKNGQPLDPADVTLKTSTPDPKGYLTLDPDGNIVLGANPPAGDYELTYEICEKLNLDNCSSNTVKVTVGMPAIDAVEDVIASINGNIGGKTISLIANDKLNGNPIAVGTAAGEVKFEIVGTLPTGLALNSDYTISVSPNTPKGDYKVEYKICEITNPTNCDSVIITVPVTAGNLVANADDIPSVSGSNAPQTLGKNIFDNDTKNGQPLDPADVTLKTSTPDPKGYLILDPDGNIVLGANPPAGDYELTYEICEKLNPDNCSSNTVKVTVGMPAIDAVEDVIASLNGNIGGKTISLIANDKLNGNPIAVGTAAGEVKFEIVGTLPTGLILNSDYTISVAPNTPKGDYKIEYKICEITNPTNCDSVIISVPVTAGDLVANEDLVPAVGVNIPQKVVNVFDNDTKDGKALVPSDVNLTVTKADPNGYLTVDADGNVTLAPNAPAGDYELTYTICEKLNPDNCDSNIVKVTVTEPKMTITADSYCSNNVPYVNYTVSPDNFVAHNLLTVKWIDSNNNVVATQTNLPLSGNLLWPGAEIDSNGNGIDWPGWILNNGIWTEGADGFEATRNGVKIEFSLNPTVTVSVAYPPAKPDCNARPTFAIKANNDVAGPVDAKKGANASVNIFENDLLNGVKFDPSAVILSVPVANPNISLNADGSINIATDTPDGVYELTYQICEAANTSNCSQAVIKITVKNEIDAGPPTANQITLNDDNDVSVDGINGSLEFINVLDNDLINGKPINPADVVVKPLTESPYFEWNEDGTVNVKPNTPGGNYPLTYQVCEKANPTNCSTATLNVFVEVPTISVIKTAVFNDENKSGFANAGETITYKFTVTNTGNVPLVGITINDPLPGVVVSGQAISLGVNESNETNFTAVYQITQEDINRGSVSNQATVKGSSVRGVAVEDQSDDLSNDGDSPTVLDLNGCSIKVMNAFSPNGDNKNARFYIRGIECYPDNTVEIYNRWGVLVFNIDSYNNNDRVFVGYSNGRSTIKQTDGLPVGTYFYILKYKDSAQKSHQESGYLYLNK